MTVDRALLARYFRQLADLGIDDVFFDTMTADDALAVMSGRTCTEVDSTEVDSRELLSTRSPFAARDAAAGAVTAGAPGNGATADRLSALGAEAAVCTSCGLHAGRGSVVFGEGSPTAQVVVVGEAPGQEEDRTGRPFVGRAGQLLDTLLMSVGLPRGDVYICNTLKCRPPQNRNPQPDELAACGRFLREQLDAISPRVMLAVGKFAAQALLETEQSIGRLRNVVHSYGGTPLIVTYHPAYLLRSPQMTRIAWQDFQMLRRVLDEQA
ncbi:hypothetical protein BH23GEM10_BH23GEM10_14550 [soil metagenome]